LYLNNLWKIIFLVPLKKLDTRITCNNCGFPKRFFEFFNCPQEIKLVWNARVQIWPRGGVWFSSVSPMPMPCKPAWIYMPRLLDPCQIGCTWFWSTYSEHYGILYDRNADLVRAGARPSSTARFYDIKFQRRAQMTDLRRRTVPDDTNLRYKRKLQQENISNDIKAFSTRTLGDTLRIKVGARVAVNASITMIVLEVY